MTFRAKWIPLIVGLEAATIVMGLLAFLLTSL
jgi:hypothetical protein